MKMCNFLFLKKFFIAILIVILSAASASAQGLTGSGNEDDPYLIYDLKDWSIFANNTDYWESDVYVKLADNIVGASVVVGTERDEFKGHFDGDWYTITFDLGNEKPYDKEYAAVFSYVDGAEIYNLTVDGLITTTAQYAGTIVGCVKNTLRPTELTSCTSNCYIHSEYRGRAYAGGLIGYVAAGRVNFKWCIFGGGIVGENSSSCAGFVGYVDDGCAVNYDYCTMAYKMLTLASNFYTFHILHANAAGNFDGNTYYTRPGDIVQGLQAPYRDVPEGVISKMYTYSRDVNYYVPAADIEFDATAIYGGSIKPVVSYYGKELVYDEEYHAGVDGGKMKIVGDEVHYIGLVEVSGITTVSINTWAELKAAMYNNSTRKRIFTLEHNYTAGASDGVLLAYGSGRMTLNMNGYTIDRNLYSGDPVNDGCAIKVDATANLTIVGPGVVKGGNNKGVGGGILCEGTMTLKGITIERNKIEYLNNDYGGLGGGVGVKNGSRDCLIEGCTIQYNWSNAGGGGLYSTSSKLVLKRDNISYNSAYSKGGAIRLLGSNANISDCVFDHNILVEHDAADGGGVWSDGSGHNFTRCTFTNNNAYRWGGGYYMIAGEATLTDCNIQHNSSLTNGGGIYVNKGTCTLDGTKVMRNSSNATGGVCLYQSASLMQVKGEVIIDMNNGDVIKKNLYMSSGNKLTICGNLTGNAFIGISRDATGVITDGLNTYEGGISNFRSDNYKMYWLRTVEREMSLQSSLYWNNSSNWGEFIIKKGNDYIIKAPIIVSNTVVASANSITYVEPGIIFVDDGGQLEYSASSVPVSVLKKVNSAGKGDDDSYSRADTFGWYGIATPARDLKLSGDEATTNIITAQSAPYNFDLLCYDEPHHYWQSYTDPLNTATYFPDDKLEVGRGYIYRTAKTESSKSFIIEFTGNLNPGDVEYELSYTPKISGENNPLAGFNLIGNPYTHRIRKGDGRAIPNGDLLATGYYTIEFDGSLKAQTDGNAIKVCQGIFVKALRRGTLTMSNIALSKEEEEGNMRGGDDELKFTVANSKYEDVTYAVFTKGHGLNKIGHNNPEIPMIYINQDDDDYAVATMGDATKQFNLNFKAKTAGRYSLSYDAKGEFSYLHVIDRFTGEDIDMLMEGEYSFVGSPKDSDARFIVRLVYKPGNSDDDSFAYQSGDEIVVSGEGELRMYDVMGRLVATQYVNGVGTMHAASVSTGVYILRLNEKTQKIIVR